LHAAAGFILMHASPFGLVTACQDRMPEAPLRAPQLGLYL
jgi:hypothetical protein